MQSIPSDLLVNIISYTEEISVKDLSLVSKQWKQITKLALTSLFNTYKDEPQLKDYVDSSTKTLSLEAADEEKVERVKLIFHAVVQEAKELNIISKVPLVSMDRLIVENLKHVSMQIHLIKQAEQLNLIFIRLSETLPAAKIFLDQLPSIEHCPLDRAQQIREWMADNPASLMQVTSLDLSYLNLQTLPKEIGLFTQLENLYLYHNQLKELPSQIGLLSKLQELYLNNNQLIELPAIIENLTQLQTLYLSKNQLKELPLEIGNLTQLKYFYLNKNQLKELPAEIGKLTQLQSLNLTNNPLQEIPNELRQSTNEDINQALQNYMLNWQHPPRKGF